MLPFIGLIRKYKLVMYIKIDLHVVNQKYPHNSLGIFSSNGWCARLSQLSNGEIKSRLSRLCRVLSFSRRRCVLEVDRTAKAPPCGAIPRVLIVRSDNP